MTTENSTNTEIIDYYASLDKIIRDPVHDYVSFTKFEQEIIDTPEFQRLKDIRQLTCQHVYPAARHTRFEHSLGVMELTRQSLKHILENGAVGDKSKKSKIASAIKKHLCKKLALLTELAALLHDVGHCPFSHMGEVEMDYEKVSAELLEAVKKHNMFKLKTDDDIDACERIKSHKTAHELLSCIVILDKYGEKIGQLLCSEICDIENGKCHLNMTHADALEYVVRCVLGITYKNDSDEYKLKNLLICLINSSSLDMDKLDYIMRDSFYTAIGAPTIDAKRLFRNMYVDSVNGEYRCVYTSKAVPVLQNLIEARDSLYMWVYNHHTVVYSDFIFSYIFRRLTRNYDKHLEEKKTKDGVEIDDCSCSISTDMLAINENPEISPDWSEISYGMMPKEWLFSVRAIAKWKRSDADVLAVLNAQSNLSLNEDAVMIDREKRAVDLISNLQKREFLKPWWKTVYEYEQFMAVHFQDDSTRESIARMVCDDTLGDEFRSQIAKLVIKITQKYPEMLLDPLQDGDFFVVQRSNKFFGRKTIDDFLVYLKDNEIVGNISGDEQRRGQHYGKKLTTLLPYKDYDKWYGYDSFYVYMNRLPEDTSPTEKRQHYSRIEEIFVFVASELVKDSRETFRRKYKLTDEEATKAEKDAKENESHKVILSNYSIFGGYKDVEA